MNLKKVTFITAHSWKTKRLGGFHKFAEGACEEGIETVFFSFPRPYYASFMHTELYNKKSVKDLCRGLDYNVGKSVLHNITLKTLRLPDSAGRFLSDRMINFLLCKSFYGFRRFAGKHLAGTDVFVFESNDGTALVDKIKKLPEDIIVYPGHGPFTNLKDEMNNNPYFK